MENVTLPDGVKKNDLQQDLSLLLRSNHPATIEESAVFVRKLFEFATAFSIPTTEVELAVPFYRDALKDIPGDLLVLSYKRIVKGWKWNKIPKPADIREQIASDFATRKNAIVRAENAIKFGEEKQNEPKGDAVSLRDRYKAANVEWPGDEDASLVKLIMQTEGDI